jgi:hypothetical protein
VVELPGGLRLTGRTPSGLPLRIGATVPVALDLAQAHLFAAGPRGRRLNAPAQAQVR